MKLLFLVLFLFSGCSASQSYRTSDLTQELNKNSTQLNMISWTIERDYLDKQAFLNNFHNDSKLKDAFLIQDLAHRLSELRRRKDSILSRTSTIRSVNDKLLIELSYKNEVSKSDPAYTKFQEFKNETLPDLESLMSDYLTYKTASTDFAKFAYFIPISLTHE